MEGRTRKLRKLNYNENLDRFIPNRSAMDFDFAHYILTGGKVEKEITDKCSTSSQVYIKDLVETLNLNRTRILEFKNKAPPSSNIIHDSFSPIRRRKYVERIRNIPQNPERILDAPEIIDDFYLNILDWSCRNVVAIAMKNTVYFWDASNGKTHELLSVDDEVGPVTSVRWAPDGRHIAIGFNNSHVELWDSSAKRRLRTFLGTHGLRVSSLDWNQQILSTGGMDSLIINNDVRIRSYKVGTYSGHSGEVCGLRWSSSGRQLASGGNDNLLYTWCMSMAPSNSRTQWLHRFDDHSATVKAVSWCPFQSNLLASVGGVGDKCIKFWNSNIGACLNSVNTGSQVSSLLWNTHEREILSGHGFNDNQLTLWNYPSMVRVAELQGHASRVLGMAQSPDGYTVASIAADETLKFWNVFGTPSSQGKTVVKREREPFANAPHIR